MPVGDAPGSAYTSPFQRQMRRLFVLLLLSAAATGQEVHPRTFYDGRGEPGRYSARDTGVHDIGVSAVTPLWTLDLRGALRQETWSPETGQVSDPYVANDSRRLFFVRAGKLRAREARTGKQLWTFGVTGPVQFEVRAGSLVIVGRRTIYVLNSRTGRVRWSRSYRAPVETFSVHQDLLSVIVSERLVATDLATGRERWRVRGLYGLTQDPHHAVMATAGSVVFLELGYHSLTSSPDVFAFDVKTGRRLWRVWSHFLPLSVADGRVYLPKDTVLTRQDRPGRLTVNVFELRSGRRVGQNVYNLNGATQTVYNTPDLWDYGRAAVGGGVLYLEARRIHSRRTGLARFHLEDPGSAVFVQPGVRLIWLAGPYRGKLFVLERRGRKRQLWVGSLANPAVPVRWRSTNPIGVNPVSRLDLLGNGLYVGHTDGRFYAANIRTGRTEFSFQTDAKNFGPTRVVGKTLVVQAGNKLLAFKLPEPLSR